MTGAPQTTRLVSDATAGLISSRRKEILEAYRDRIQHSGAFLADEPGATDEAFADAPGILADLVHILGAGTAQAGHEYTRIAVAGAEPLAITQSSSLLFDAVVSVIAPLLPAETTAMPAWQTLVTTLQHILAVRTRVSPEEHTGVAPSGVPTALAEERRRIARDLHDRVGYGLSMTQRQLELHDMLRASDPPLAERHLEVAYKSVQDSMRHLRAVTSALHEHRPPPGLDAALRAYLRTADTGDSLVTLQIDGDEAGVPPEVLDECFVVLREAARNALSHARPRSLRITVDITPYELCGTVMDDGCGFDTTTSARGGLGLTSMTERTELLGGRLVCTSLIDVGTVIRLSVPLSGPSVEHVA